MAYTVTCTDTAGSNDGSSLYVAVLTGATESGGNNGQNHGVYNLSFTPTFTNSLILVGMANGAGATAYTLEANMAAYNVDTDTTGDWAGWEGHYSGTVTAATPVTVGATAGGTVADNTIAAYEVAASGGSTPALDASTPAAVGTSPGTNQPSSATTASFTPPAGSVLVAIWTEDGSVGTSASDYTVSNTGGSLTWTKRVSTVSATTDSNVTIYTATVPGGGSSPAVPQLPARPGRSKKHGHHGNLYHRQPMQVFPTVIRHVGDSTYVSGAQSGTTLVNTYTTQAGNTLVAYITGYIQGNTSIAVTSVTDTAGNNWTVVPGTSGYYGGTPNYTGCTAVAYCVNAAAVTSVTAHYSAIPNVNAYVQVSQFSGVPAGAGTDGSASASFAGTSVSSQATPNITPTASADIVIGVVAEDVSWSSVSPGTMLLDGSAAWNIVNAPNVSESFTFTGTNHVMATQTVAIGVPVPGGALTVNAGLATATGSALAPHIGITPGLATSVTMALDTGDGLKIGITQKLATATGNALAPGTGQRNTGLATATGHAFAPAHGLTSGLATGTGTSQAPGIGITPQLATGTGTALAPQVQQPALPPGMPAFQGKSKSRAQHHHGVRRVQQMMVFVPQVIVSAGLATATGSALGPGIGITPGLATGTGAAGHPGIGITPGLASGSGHCSGPAMGHAPGLATSSGSALAPGHGLTSGLATGTGHAFAPGHGLTSGLATGTGTSQAPGVGITPQLATGTGAALPPIPPISSGMPALQGKSKSRVQHHHGVRRVQQMVVFPYPPLTVTAGLATATGSALAPGHGLTPGLPSGSGNCSGPAMGHAPGLATGTGHAFSPGHGLTSGLATGTGHAFAPGHGLGSGLATGSGHCSGPGAGWSPGVAHGTGHAFAPGHGLTSGLATGTGHAFAPALGWTPGLATGTGTAFNVANGLIRNPLNLGGTATPEFPLGGTITELNLGGSVSYGNTLGGSGTIGSLDGTSGGSATLVSLDTTSGGTATTPASTLGGSVSYGNTLGGSAIGWTMQQVNLTLAENNDETVDFAITSSGSPLSLSGATINVYFKTAAGTQDSAALMFSSGGGSPAITITNSSGGLCTLAIPHADLYPETYTFYRLDVVFSSLQNTAIYGNITWITL